MTGAVPSQVVAPDLRPPLTHRLRPAHWVAIDVGLAGLLTFTEVLTGHRMSGFGYHVPPTLVWVIAAATPVVVGFRRRFPVPTLAGALLLLVLSAYAKVPGSTPAVLIVAMSLYTVAAMDEAAHRFRRGSQLALAAALIVILAVWAVRDGPRLPVTGLAAWMVVDGAAWAMGDAVRYRRAYIEGLARQAEVLADDARRTERLRIAREVHDVVAHNISVIAVTASVGGYVGRDRPDDAVWALASIETTSRSALAELRSLLGTLRDETNAVETAPTPGIADLDGVIADTLRAGVAVDVRVEGTPRPVPLAVDLAAYRIVQEALTNVIKHAGPTDTLVRLTFESERLAIEVSDAGARRPRPTPAILAGGGHGLVGMQERALLLGGTFHAGTVSPRGFRVSASLPLSDAA